MDTAANADLLIADLALFALDHDNCLGAAQRCVEASRRFGMATLPVALLWLAGAHAIGGRNDEMESILAEAVTVSDGDPRVVADEFGRVRSIAAFLSGDRQQFRDVLERSVELARKAPTTSSVFAGRLLWALLRSMDDDDLGARRGPRSGPWRTPRCSAPSTAGPRRSPKVGGATSSVPRPRSNDRTCCSPRRRADWGFVQTARLLVTQAALRDGWGDPVRWLSQLEAWFFERGLERVARDCRSMLGQAGEPVPRRRRGQAPVSPGLRALGITGREVEVLLLLAQRRSNREIAEELFLSVRTVEHHIASLFNRTGVRDRARLAEFAALV